MASHFILSSSSAFRRAPQGLEDVSRYPHLFAELLQDPRWTEEDLKKLAGLNFLRVFRQVEEVRHWPFPFRQILLQAPQFDQLTDE